MGEEHTPDDNKHKAYNKPMSEKDELAKFMNDLFESRNIVHKESILFDYKQ